MKRKKRIGTRKDIKKGRERKPLVRGKQANKSRSRAHAQRPPRSFEELFARSRSFQDLWNRAVQVPAEMRARGLSLLQASRQLRVSTKNVLRLAGSAFTKKRGRYQVKPMDRLLRVLIVPQKKGRLQEVPTRDSREASLIGEYWSAVEKFLTRGDSSALRKLRRKYVTDAHGKRVRFLMDLEELKRQASAGVLHFESLYGRRA
jgi:hypothetical protein